MISFFSKWIVFLFASSILALTFQNCAPTRFTMGEALDLGSQDFCSANPLSQECLNPLPPTCTFDGATISEGQSVTAYLNSTVPFGQSCVSQTRTCVGGSLTGSYTFSSCQAGQPQSCLFNGQTIANGQSVTAYVNSTAAAGSQCQSEQRTCQNGTLTGSFSFSSCTVQAFQSCLFNGQTLAHGQSTVAYNNSTVPFGSLCIQNTRTCYNGVLSGSGNYSSCSVNAPASCLFNGQTIAHGQNVTAYQNSSVAFGNTCTSQFRTCNNGTLSGTYQYGSCSVGAAASCLFNGQTIAHGQNVIAYLNSTVSYGNTCTSQARTCNNGVLSGTYQFGSCSVGAAASCLFNGQTVAHNQFVTAFQNSSVPFGSSCASERRQCSNGTLTGSYQHSSCSVNAAASCIFNGQTIAHGQSTTAYLNSSESFGSTCTSQQRTCNNGSLNGSYQYASCSVAAPRSCLFNGQTIASGQSITAYSTSTVPFGNTCISQQRTCTDGSLSGSYTFASCNVGSPASCTFNGQTLVHNQTVTAYSTSTVPYGQTCTSQSRTCNNGTLSGSYQYGSCSVAAPASCLMNGLTIPHGSSHTFYQSSSVPSGSVCNSQSRTCNNGVLSGTYTNNSCVVEAPQCTQSEVLMATRSYFQNITTNEMAVANTCIDGAFPTAQSSLPSNGENQYIRFFNTCGNRYCQSLGEGYIDGRVIEHNTSGVVVQCRRRDPPPTVSDSCRQKLLTLPKPVDTLSVTDIVVADHCIDGANPTRELNLPTSPSQSVRFHYTCGARWCRSKGYSNGRVIENSYGNLQVNCYREEIFNQLQAGTVISTNNVTVDAVAQSCIDGAVTTVSGSYPDQGATAFLRFVNTCGNRYCVNNGLGQSGWITEILPNSPTIGARTTSVVCSK